jgi:hypothetical protein
MLGRFSYVREHPGFVVELSFWINSNEVISQDAP